MDILDFVQVLRHRDGRFFLGREKGSGR
jgi:hypothetical protein